MSSFVKASGGLTPNSADPGEEFPFLHTITVVDRVVSVDKPELVQNNIKTETVTLDLDSEWEGLSTVINIGNGKTPTSLIWSGQPVIIPAELMTDIGTLNVSVVGYGDDGAVRAVTKKADAMFTVVASGYVEGDEPVPDPTTILGQLTEAADRANQAAQNAEDSTIDKVSVTMLPTGSSASGSVSDKTLSLRIPNGPQGPQGPKGDPGDLTTVAHDGTLTGDGTSGSPLAIADGNTFSKPIRTVNNLNDAKMPGLYDLNASSSNGPHSTTGNRGGVIVVRNNDSSIIGQIAVQNYSRDLAPGLYFRSSQDAGDNWSGWGRLAFISEVNALTSSIAGLSTRMQALEARVNSQETN